MPKVTSWSVAEAEFKLRQHHRYRHLTTPPGLTRSDATSLALHRKPTGSASTFRSYQFWHKSERFILQYWYFEQSENNNILISIKCLLFLEVDRYKLGLVMAYNAR